jgi:photosystem I subunit 8
VINTHLIYRLSENIIDYFMAAAYLPSVLVPLVGLVFPAIAMASLFIYIEKEEIA